MTGSTLGEGNGVAASLQGSAMERAHTPGKPSAETLHEVANVSAIRSRTAASDPDGDGKEDARASALAAVCERELVRSGGTERSSLTEQLAVQSGGSARSTTPRGPRNPSQRPSIGDNSITSTILSNTQPKKLEPKMTTNSTVENTPLDRDERNEENNIA